MMSARETRAKGDRKQPSPARLACRPPRFAKAPGPCTRTAAHAQERARLHQRAGRRARVAPASRLWVTRWAGSRALHLLALNRLRHVAGRDLLREALRDRGLAHAGLADEARVVLRAPAQDLRHALDLLLPAHHRVQLALRRRAEPGSALP